MKTIYIAGPMTGHPCYNFKRFFYWQVVLEGAGYEVLNPAEIDTLKMFGGWRYDDSQYPSILLHDIELIKKNADGIFLLNGHEQSPGASAELSFASAIGVKRLSEHELVRNSEEIMLKYPTMDSIIATREVLHERF